MSFVLQNRKPINRKIKIDEFTIVDEFIFNPEELNEIYSQQSIIRFFNPRCNIQSNDYFRFKEFLTAIEGTRIQKPNQTQRVQSDGQGETLIGTRGALAIVEFFKQRRELFAPDQINQNPLPITPITPLNPVERERLQKQQLVTPISSTELEKTKFTFDRRNVVLKIADDISAKEEISILQFLEKQQIQTGKNPHLSKLFATRRCTLDEKLLNPQISQSFARALERILQTNPQTNEPFLLTSDGSNANTAGNTISDRLFYYILTEYATLGSVSSILSKRFSQDSINSKNIRSLAFQMTFGLMQLHKEGIVHRDFNENNITLTKNETKDWLTQYNIFAGDITMKNGEVRVLYEFFDPFLGNKHEIVKIIDFETVQNTKQEKNTIRRPITTLSSRPPEQLLSSLRQISPTAPDGLLPQYTLESDMFSLGVVLANMYLTVNNLTKNWSILTLSLDVENEPMFNEIRTVVRNFDQKARDDLSKRRLRPTEASVKNWTTVEPSLLIYIENIVYLLGPPKFDDLNFIGFEDQNRDYLWLNLFSKFNTNAEPQLKKFLIQKKVPLKAVQVIVSLLKWNKNDRDSALDILLSKSLFSKFRQAQTTLQEYVELLNANRQKYVIFGDSPVTQLNDNVQVSRSGTKRNIDASNTTETSRSKISRIETQIKKSSCPSYNSSLGTKLSTLDQKKTVKFDNLRPFELEYILNQTNYTSRNNSSIYVLNKEHDNTVEIPFISNSIIETLQESVKSNILNDTYILLRNSKDKRCGHCKRLSKPLKRCSKCKKAFYCGQQCQQYHWHYEHKFECLK